VTIVLDTNVIFAALTAKEGFCARLFELCLSRHSVVSSQYILDELRRHLAAKHQLGPKQIEAAILALNSPVVRIVNPAPVPLARAAIQMIWLFSARRSPAAPRLSSPETRTC
jgi:predicted nucleic acid-binding protein